MRAGSLLLLLWLPAVARADFDKSVAPVLLRHCGECHMGGETAGGLDLGTHQGLLAGGSKGAVITKVAGESPLLVRILQGEMPPRKGKRPAPTKEEIEILRTWIAAGAPWPEKRRLDPFEITTSTRAGRDWWSLQPIQQPPIPAGHGANPIDAFLRAKLAPRGWTFAPQADRRTLIRRLYSNLLGLPPTFEEVEAFVSDPSPLAYERLVDRLLASPHAGERRGRYWLDIVRYAETCGYERDQAKPGIWKYRDRVIRAFNDDLPYDRFVLEQLAGDEMAGASEETVVSTGFIRLGTWNDEPNDPDEYKYDRLEDMVGATSTAFLGLTVRCARCHDHKFDPIRQTDYYRMAGAFWAGPIEPGPRELLGGPDRKLLGHDVHGWTDRGAVVPPLRLLKKGDPKRPGAVVPPGHLSLVPSLEKPLPAPPPGAKTTQRRLHMARWITDPQNPLTARVWVNRLWQFHFGQGLVRTPDNFGFNGDKPSHPELLDWLASRLIDEGWRSRPIDRLILLSEAYRQSSLHPHQEEYAKSDAGNRLWWRAERRRLDAESLRDALLHAGGNLRREQMGGPSFAPVISADALEGLSMKGAAWKASPASEQGRRSVYIFTKRGLLPPLLTTFDFGDTTGPNCQRDVTIVAPQALALLNNPFVHEQSEALGKRVGTGERAERVRLAWRLALGRSPRPMEVVAALGHVERQERYFAANGRQDAQTRAMASLCHVLLNTNEFCYVD